MGHPQVHKCGLSGAVAGGAWAVMPPAYGLGRFVEGIAVVAGMLLSVGPVEAEPVVFVFGGAVALRFLRGGGGAWRCHGQKCGAGEE
jgi:hypothetical protein